MAYATIAGLPIQVGLYTAIVPMAVYAALGTSRPLSVSTTTTIAILSAAALGQAAPGGSAGELIAASATLATQAVPEPATIVLLGTFCVPAALGFWMRRRRLSKPVE